eukprot:COSAG01_NODE_4080_length_5376_cov_171.292401_6_plen_77_part_00
MWWQQHSQSSEVQKTRHAPQRLHEAGKNRTATPGDGQLAVVVAKGDGVEVVDKEPVDLVDATTNLVGRTTTLPTAP